MHTVELLLDARLECGVRDLWNTLRDAGLPSLATHPHPTNRPHLTVLTARSLAGLPSLPTSAESGSLPVELGRIRLLGRALVREVTATPALRDLQRRVWSALAGAEPWPAPADWVPHVSLALKVSAAQGEEALRMLATAPSVTGHIVAARSYDTHTRTVTEL